VDGGLQIFFKIIVYQTQHALDRSPCKEEYGKNNSSSTGIPNHLIHDGRLYWIEGSQSMEK